MTEAELREWLRENLIIETGYVDPHCNDVRVMLRLRDDDTPFAYDVVSMPEKTK